MRKQIRKKIVMSVQIILSFRKCDKSHIQAFPSLRGFFLGLIFFISAFNLTNLRAINSSFSFSQFIIISQSKEENKTKSCFGWNFFLSPWQAEKKLDIFNILRNSGKDKRKRDAKACQKKYNEKWWRIDKKPRLLWFPVSGISLSCLLFTKEQYYPAIFIPHLEPIKTQEFGLNHRSSYRWPDPPSGQGKNDSSITVTQFQIFQSFIHHLFSIFPHHKTAWYYF